MNKKQIRRDYENIDYIDEKGKVRTKVVYKGAYYAPEDVGKFKKTSVIFVFITALFLVGLLVPLIIVNSAVKALYFSLPFILQGVSAVFYLIASLDILTERPPFNETTKKSLSEHVKGATIFGIICSCVYAVGYVILAAKGELSGFSDVITGVCAALCIICHIFALKLNIITVFKKTSDPGTVLSEKKE